jgi:hypothetical protein
LALDKAAFSLVIDAPLLAKAPVTTMLAMKQRIARLSLSERQIPLMRCLVYRSKHWWHGRDRDESGKCESCLAVVLDIFVSLGERSERADFLELVIRAQSLLGWTPYLYLL